MARIWERDPRQRQLTTIYVPQEARPLMPTELSDEIVLVHPAQPFPASFHQLQRMNLISAVGVEEVLGPEPGPDRYFWVHAFDTQHNDTVATHNLELRLRFVDTGEFVRLEQVSDVPTLIPIFGRRSILVPPGMQLTGISTEVIAAGAQMRLRAYYLDLAQAELPPWL